MHDFSKTDAHAPSVGHAHTYNFPLTDSSSPLTCVVIRSLTENQSKKPAVLQALLKYRNLGLPVGGTCTQMCLKSCTDGWSVMVDGFSGIQDRALRSDVKKNSEKQEMYKLVFIRHEWAAVGSDHVWSRWVKTQSKLITHLFLLKLHLWWKNRCQPDLTNNLLCMWKWWMLSLHKILILKR